MQNPNQLGWFLEGYLEDRKTVRRWMVDPLPFRVGRSLEMNMRLPFVSISGRHAELYVERNQLHIRDLGSTNGTFVNRKRVQEPAVLHEGDVLHFSEYEFRVGCREPEVVDSSHTMYARILETDLPQQMAVGTREFKQMMETGAVAPLYQPIVRITDGEIIGFEILGRGSQEGLATSPGELFRIAASLGLETELSMLFRLRGVQEAVTTRVSTNLFFNTHPAEMETPELVQSLKQLREVSPLLPLVLEIHETAVTDLEYMRQLRALLDDLEIALAYDDFGAGQARLAELVDVPPDYLKFDAGLIHDIHRSPASRQKMVESLAQIANEIGVRCVAEGIEIEDERKVCLEMGFHLAQGYLFGKPDTLTHWFG